MNDTGWFVPTVGVHGVLGLAVGVLVLVTTMSGFSGKGASLPVSPASALLAASIT